MGQNHATLSFALIYGATGRFLPASLASVGAVFPDAIERLLFGQKWQKHHRKGSHWFPPYLLGAWVASVYLRGHPFGGIVEVVDAKLYVPIGTQTVAAAVAFGLFWFMAGCLLHIVEDCFFGPMPLVFPWKRQRLIIQIFKTGGPAERIIARCALILAVVGRFVDVSRG